MLVRKPRDKKRPAVAVPANTPLDSSLTSIEWLPKMQIGENSSASSAVTSASPLTTTTTTTTQQQALPVISNIPHKHEAIEVDLPTTMSHEISHTKPPYSYVTLIRQAIQSTRTQRMTLNEIYQWIIDAYPFFRTASPKWKNSIRHNLSLNKSFKRLQRSTNDPGKGSYWAVDESFDNNSQSNSRKRKFDEIQPSMHMMSPSPSGSMQQHFGLYTNNNPMICGDFSSVGGQSSSTDESDSTTSLVANPSLLPTDDFNFDLTASFRRFVNQVLETSTGNVLPATDGSSNNTNNPTLWNPDLFPNGDSSNFVQSIKMASSGEINFNEIDIKPYCEFLESFRSTSTFQQDPDHLINLTSSLTSFFDHTGITNLAQSRIANDSYLNNQPTMGSNLLGSGSINDCSYLASVTQEQPEFDYTSII